MAARDTRAAWTGRALMAAELESPMTRPAHVPKALSALVFTVWLQGVVNLAPSLHTVT